MTSAKFTIDDEVRAVLERAKEDKDERVRATALDALEALAAVASRGAR